MAIDPATLTTIVTSATRLIGPVFQGLRRFYAQPDGWPMKVETVAWPQRGWLLLGLDFERRDKHPLRAECPRKIRKRFGDCNARQWLLLPDPAVIPVEDAVSRGYVYIYWSDEPTWSQLTVSDLQDVTIAGFL